MAKADSPGSAPPVNDVSRPLENTTKAELELDKLRAEIAALEARQTLQREQLEREKLNEEIKALRQRTTGTEKHSMWQRAQFGAAIAAATIGIGSFAVAFLTYRSAAEDRRNRDFNTAVQQFHNGQIAGALSLANMGDDGIQALVYSIDATGRRETNAWPELTLAALDELRKNEKRVTEEQKIDLREMLKQNERMIAVTLYPLQDEGDREENPDATAEKASALKDQLRSLTCVQLKLQRLVGASAAVEWPSLKGQVVRELRELPPC